MLTSPHAARETANTVMGLINRDVKSLGAEGKKTTVCLLFDQICLNVSTMSEEGIMKRVLEFVQKVICALYEAREPLKLLMALNSLFLALGNRDVPQLYPVVAELLTGLLDTFREPLSWQQRTLTLEIALMIPVKLNKCLTLFPLVMDIALIAMEQPEEKLVMKGLDALDLFVKHVDRKFLTRESRRFLSRINAALNRQSRSKLPEVRTKAMRLIGMFGTSAVDAVNSLEYHEVDEHVTVPVNFLGYANTIHLPVKEMVEGAVKMLHDPTIDSVVQNHCYEVVKSFICAAFAVDGEPVDLMRLLSHPSFTDQSTKIPQITSPQYKMLNKCVRNVHVKALTGIVLASRHEDIRGRALQMVSFLSSYYAYIAVIQQAGPCPLPDQTMPGRGIDVYTYVDAITAVLVLSDSEFVRPALLAFMFILKAAIRAVGSKDRIGRLPLVEYIRQRLIEMCYERMTQHGAMLAIRCMLEQMGFVWTCTHCAAFVRCFIYIIRDVSCKIVVDYEAGKKHVQPVQISHTLRERARGLIEKLVFVITTKLRDSDVLTRKVQAHSVMELTRELAYGLTDSDPDVRHMAMFEIGDLARHHNVTVAQLLAPHKSVLCEKVLPNHQTLCQLSNDNKIAALEATAFCIEIANRVYDFDPNLPAHKEFLEEVFVLCRSEEGIISSDREQYLVYEEPWGSASRWGSEGWVKVRQAGIRLLTKLHFLVDFRERIVLELFELVKCRYPEIQDAACDGLVTFCSGFDFSTIRDLVAIEVEASLNYVNNAKFESGTPDEVIMTPSSPSEDIDMTFGECREAASMEAAQDRVYLRSKRAPNLCMLRTTELLVQLFPETAAKLTRKFAALLLNSQMGPNNFYEIASDFASRRQHLLNLSLTSGILAPECLELWLVVYSQAIHMRQPLFPSGNSFLRNLLVKLILANPVAAAAHLLVEDSLLDPALSSLLLHVLRRDDGQPLRSRIQDGAGIHLLGTLGDMNQCPEGKVSEVRYQTIRVIHLLAKRNTKWLAGTSPLMAKLRMLWSNEMFHKLHSESNTVPPHHWNCPRLLGQILLQHYIHNSNDLLLIFQLMRPFTSRYIADFKWLSLWLEASVPRWSISQRRLLFFVFSETMATAMRTTRHQAAILGKLITPNLRYALQQSTEVLGSQSWNTERIDPNNIPSIFAHHVLELSMPMDDFLRVEILKLGILLVNLAPNHIHNGKPVAAVQQPSKTDILQKILTYAWQVQLEHVTKDPLAKQHGLLLLATVISKLPMRNRLLKDVMQGLLNSDSIEERSLALQSLELAMPQVGRLPNGPAVLHCWLTEIAQHCEEGGSHMTFLLQSIIRCHWIFYNTISLGTVEFLSKQVQVMGSHSTSSLQRSLAVDIIDTLIQWAERSKTRAGGNVQLVNYAEAGPSRAGEAGGSVVVETVDHFKPTFFLNQLLRIGAMSSEGLDCESMRQLTDRCINLINTVFRLKLATDTSVIDLEWLLSMLRDTHSAQCQETVLKLLMCIVKHAPLAQASMMAARLKSSEVDFKQPNVLPLIHRLSVSLYELIPAELKTVDIVQDPVCEPIYTLLEKMITDGISTLGLNSDGSLEPLLATMRTLESLKSVRPATLDRFFDHICCTICDLARYDGDPNYEQGDAVSAILVKLLELVSTRAQHLGAVYRKQFVGVVLVEVINKTRHAAVLSTVIALAKAGLTKKAGGSEADLRQMFCLLVQITPNIKARFSKDYALQERFLQIVLCVYKDKSLRPIEHGRKLLEAAVTMGLQNPGHETRSKFLMLIDSTVRRRLDKRMMNCTSVFWRSLKNWTPYAIDHIFAMISTTTSNPAVQQSISLSNPGHRLPEVGAIAGLAGHQIRDFCTGAEIKDPQLLNDVQSLLNYFDSVKEVRCITLLHSAAQLCHANAEMARKVWIDIFPKVWEALTLEQQMEMCTLPSLMAESLPVDHAVAAPTGDSIMLEALAMCHPFPHIHWGLLQYAGKYHNLWHCMALAMEEIPLNWDSVGVDTNNLNVEEGLIRLYMSMSETDLMCAVQRKRAKIPSAKVALTLWQLGNFEEARQMTQRAVAEIEMLMNREEHVDTLNSLDQLWNDCTKELGQWESLVEVEEKTAARGDFHLAECAWRLQDFDELARIVLRLQGSSCRQNDWKIHLYDGYIGLLADAYDHAAVADCVKRARDACCLDWIRLPATHCDIHVPVMQEAQLIVELEEANDLINKVIPLLRNQLDESTVARIVRAAAWRLESRSSNAVDGFAHLSAVGALRQGFYAAVMLLATGQQQHEVVDVVVTAYENSAIELGRVARKRWMPQLCIDLLLPKCSGEDGNHETGWQRLRQIIKAACQMPYMLTEGTDFDPLALLREVNIESLPSEWVPDALTLGAKVLRQFGQDIQADSWLQRSLESKERGKASEIWAEQLEKQSPLDTQRAQLAMRSWLAAEKETGSVSCRILARVIWLVQCCDDSKRTLASELEESHNVRLAHWLPWVPQLLQVYTASGGSSFFQLLVKLAVRYPQPVYFQLRTLYISEKAALKTAKQARTRGSLQAEATAENVRQEAILTITAKLLAFILLQNTTIVSPLETMASELMLLKDSWVSSTVRDLRQIRRRYFNEAFTHLDNVAEATASPSLCTFINNRIIKRGFQENLNYQKQNSWMLTARMQLVQDFEKVFTPAKGIILQQVPRLVDRWLAILEPKCQITDSVGIGDRCRYLGSFSRFTSNVGMFDEDHSIVVPSRHRVTIHNFIPIVETVLGRRWLRIVGSDGHTRTFQLVTDANTDEIRKHDLVLQTLNLLNEDLGKDRETSRRRLRFSFPHVTSLSHDMQLVAVTPAIMSSLQVHQQTGNKMAKVCVAEFYQQVANLQAAFPYAMPDRGCRRNFYDGVRRRWNTDALKTWGRKSFPDPEQFWVFRKTMTSSLALLLTAEHALNLTRIDAEDLLIDRSSGIVHSNAVTFDIRQLNMAVLQSLPVAFRLTVSLVELIGETQIEGPLKASMMAISRCLSRPTAAVSACLRAVLVTETPPQVKADSKAVQRRTTEWTAAIIARLTAMAQMHGKGCVASLIEGALNVDNLSQMDPNWLPWL